MSSIGVCVPIYRHGPRAGCTRCSRVAASLCFLWLPASRLVRFRISTDSRLRSLQSLLHLAAPMLGREREGSTVCRDIEARRSHHTGRRVSQAQTGPWLRGCVRSTSIHPEGHVSHILPLSWCLLSFSPTARGHREHHYSRHALRQRCHLRPDWSRPRREAGLFDTPFVGPAASGTKRTMPMLKNRPGFSRCHAAAWSPARAV